MENKQIREYAKKSNVTLWQLADHLGIAESTLYRHLRYKIVGDKLTSYLTAIDEIVGSRKSIGGDDDLL